MTPSTEAGLRLLGILPGPDKHGNGIAWEQRILAIEAQAVEAARAAIEAPWREAAQAVLDEWDSFGPTGTLSTLATHRRLRALLTQPEKENS